MANTEIEITSLDDKMDIIHDIEDSKIYVRRELLLIIIMSITEIINPFLEVNKKDKLTVSIKDIPSTEHLVELYNNEKDTIKQLNTAKTVLDKESNRNWFTGLFTKKEYSQAKINYDKAAEDRNRAFLNVSAELKDINIKIKTFTESIIQQLNKIDLSTEQNLNTLKDKLLLFSKLLVESINTKKVYAEPLFIALNKSKQYIVKINSINNETIPYIKKLELLNGQIAKGYADINEIYKTYTAKYTSSNFQFTNLHNDDLKQIILSATAIINSLKDTVKEKKGGATEVDVNNKLKDTEKIIVTIEQYKEDILKKYNSLFNYLQITLTDIDKSLKQADTGLGGKKNLYKFAPKAIETIYTAIQNLETKFKLEVAQTKNIHGNIANKIEEVSKLTNQLQDSINSMLNLNKVEINAIKTDIENSIREEKEKTELVKLKNDINNVKNSIETNDLIFINKLKPIDDYQNLCKTFLNDQKNVTAYKTEAEKLDIVLFSNITKLINEKNYTEFNQALNTFFDNYQTNIKTPVTELERNNRDLYTDILNKFKNYEEIEQKKIDLKALTDKNYTQINNITLMINKYTPQVKEYTSLSESITEQSQTADLPDMSQFNFDKITKNIHIDTLDSTSKEIDIYEVSIKDYINNNFKDAPTKNNSVAKQLYSNFKGLLEIIIKNLQELKTKTEETYNSAKEDIITEINKLAGNNSSITEENITEKIKELYNNLKTAIDSTYKTSENIRTKIDKFIQSCNDNFNTSYNITELFSKKETLIDRLNNFTSISGGAIIPTIDYSEVDISQFINNPTKTPDQIKALDAYNKNKQTLDVIKKEIIDKEQVFSNSIKTYLSNFDAFSNNYKNIEAENDINKLKDLENKFYNNDLQTTYVNSRNDLLKLKKLYKDFNSYKQQYDESVTIIQKLSSPTQTQSPIVNMLSNQPVPGIPYPTPYQSPIITEQQNMLLKIGLSDMLDRRVLPLKLMLPLLLSVIVLMLGFIVSIYYIVITGTNMLSNSAVSSPLNNQTTDFETIKSLSFFGSGQFNYLNFLVLPLLSLVGIVIFGVVSYVSPTENPIPREVKGFVFIIGLSAVVTFVMQYLIYTQLGSVILNVSKRLNYFNNYVCIRIYKNFSFLNTIKDPQTSIINVDITMQSALKAIPEDASVIDMAKAFFTLTMFYHYQKIGLRNQTIFKAFDLFDPLSLLTGGCSPGDYLSRYGTYIEDITETIIREQIPKVIINSRKQEFEEAIMLCNEWITNSNGFANTIYPEDAFKAFIVMAIATIIVQILPFILFKIFYGNPSASVLTSSLRGFTKLLGI